MSEKKKSFFKKANKNAAPENLSAEERAKASDALAGLTFVISGSFANHSRDELKALIEANGGKNLAAVSANTSYLLAGDKIGPTKLQKANKLGIKIISEDEFVAMIGDTTPAEPLATPQEAATPPAATAKQPPKEENNPQPVQGSLF